MDVKDCLDFCSTSWVSLFCRLGGAELLLQVSTGCLFWQHPLHHAAGPQWYKTTVDSIRERTSRCIVQEQMQVAAASTSTAV
jgi:hypothetical protein